MTPSAASLPPTQQRIVLAARPEGEARLSDFRLEEVPLAPPEDGEVLVRHAFLSLDPYMRGRMNAGKSYAEPQPLDEVMVGGTVGHVVASRNPAFAVGDAVVGMGGWQQYARVNATQRGALQKVDAQRVPLSAYLGPVGMPGVTAWYGLNRILVPKAGETVAVSAASGAVGSVVGQLAKAQGARVVGIAGGPQKCAYVVEELGFDACIDHRAHAGVPALAQALKQACPQGIDGYFDNVGAGVLDAVMLRTNAFARIAVCGMIAGYDGAAAHPMQAPALILVNRLRVEGFIVSDHMALWPQALGELAEAVRSGRLKYRESIAEGLAAAPQAFLGLLRGENFGKQLVRLG